MHSKSFSIYRIHSFHTHSIYSFYTLKIHVEVCLNQRPKFSDNSVAVLITFSAFESISESKVLVSSLSESASEYEIQNMSLSPIFDFY